MPAKSCAVCARPVHPDYHPFCSKRCADIDLHRWLGGHYALPGSPVERLEDLPGQDETE